MTPHLSQLVDKTETNIAKKCAIPECERGGRIVRGWCRYHWQRWYRTGDPEAGPTTYSTPEESFDARTEWRGSCLIWTGATTTGYGVIRVDGRNMLAHRFAWERARGPIPEGMRVDHRDHCAKACVNVSHLRLATQTENGQNRRGPNSNNTLTKVRNVTRRANGRYF